MSKKPLTSFDKLINENILIISKFKVKKLKTKEFSEKLVSIREKKIGSVPPL